ncbi:MAG TPA: insulinase family protein [Aeromonadales bacterium]|nr:insulinase family protein [Aeromonadales bacterium]
MKLSHSIIAIIATLLFTACSDNNSTTPRQQSSADSGSSHTTSSKVAERPESLKFSPFKVDIPLAEKYRHELNGKNVAYIMEDHGLPLVQIHLFSRAGWYLLEDKDIGVSYVFDNMLREGGTETLSPTELNEKLDFLATTINFSTRSTSASANMDTLTSNLDESLALFFDMLQKPGLAVNRLEVAKSKALERIKRRNDDTRSIEPRVFNELLRGESFFDDRMATSSQIKAVTPQQLKHYIQKIYANGQLIVAVSGDVQIDDIINRLNNHLQTFDKADKLPAIPSELKPAKPGLYGVDKADVTQSRVSVGHLGIKRGNKDELAVLVMNDILGGGGFTSRITSRVRSDEGLAYSAGSYFNRPSAYQGIFRAYFQSKNKSVAYALKIVLEEINNIRDNKVTAKELNVAKQSVNSILGNVFRSADAKVQRFVADDLAHVAADYWSTFESKVMALTEDSIQQVAKKYLHPDKMRILVVGALDEVKKGDGEHGTLEEVAGSQLIQLPLKDPLTLKPLPIKQ